MKRVFILLLIAFSPLNAFCQDLIVTIGGDTLNCRISRVSSENVYFTFRHDWDITDSVLSISKIKTKQLNYFSRSEIPKDWNSGIGKFRSFQLSIDGGLSLRIGRLAENIPKELIDYYNNLKFGYHIGASAFYFLNDRTGIGLKYQCFLSANSIDNVHYIDLNGYSHFGNLRDKLNITFVGPSYSTRYPFGKGENAFFTNYFAGPIFFRDDALLNQALYKITGASIGFGIEGGYDIEISQNFLIGFQASLLGGVIKSVKVDNGIVQSINLEKGSYESLYRIDFSIGIRFR